MEEQAFPSCANECFMLANMVKQRNHQIEHLKEGGRSERVFLPTREALHTVSSAKISCPHYHLIFEFIRSKMVFYYSSKIIANKITI